MGREVRTRLARRQDGAEVQLWEYPMAGHSMAPRGIGASLTLGGTVSANAHAKADSWSRLRLFLRKHLGEFAAK
jgi:hypothetical protein